MKTVGFVELETVLARVESGFDGRNGRSTLTDRQHSDAFQRGINCAGDMKYVTIALNNVWGGRSACGGSVSSYEKIGYHAGSTDFIAGVIHAGCPVFAYCEDGWRRVWM